MEDNTQNNRDELLKSLIRLYDELTETLALRRYAHDAALCLLRHSEGCLDSLELFGANLANLELKARDEAVLSRLREILEGTKPKNS